MSKFRLRWGEWLYGLVGGIIGGGASGFLSSIVAMGVTPQAYNLHAELSHTLQLFVGCFIGNGIVSACLWLRQKPLPEIQNEPEQDPGPPFPRR